MAKLLKDVEVGSLVKLNESGVPVEFYVAKHDYEAGLNGKGRTLLVRKEVLAPRPFGTSTVYVESSICDFLNKEYKKTFDKNVQKEIKETTFFCTKDFTYFCVHKKKEKKGVL